MIILTKKIGHILTLHIKKSPNKKEASMLFLIRNIGETIKNR